MSAGAAGRPRGYADAWAAAREIEGWLTEAQARRLWEAAERAGPAATVVEIGSFRGRSAVVLALAVPADATVVAVDPHAGGDRGPREIAPDPARGEADCAAFHANLARAGVAARVRHVRRPSQAALGEVVGAIDVLYVDGAHRYGPARDDLERWGGRVAPGGTVLVHDAFSAVGVTLALLRVVCGRGELRYLGRTGSLAEYRREPLAGRDRARDAARQLAQLGWFARNLLVKVALVTQRPRVARALGHDAEHWPF